MVNEKEVRSRGEYLSKTRIVKGNAWGRQQYIEEHDIEEANNIMKMRLFMVKLPCNIRNNNEKYKCNLCDKYTYIRMEHYMTCKGVEHLRKCWNVEGKSLRTSEANEQKRLGKYFNSVSRIAR